MIVSVIKFVFWFLVFMGTEKSFRSFVGSVLPRYKRRLQRHGLLRQYTSNMPALFHSVIATTYALYCIASGTFSLPVFTAAYFVYDISQNIQADLLVHHAIACVMLAISESTSERKRFAGYIMFTECSTIFLCLLLIFRGPGKAQRVLESEERAIVDKLKVAFAATFLATRILLLPCVIFVFLRIEDLVACLSVSLLWCLNIHWLEKMVRFVR